MQRRREVERARVRPPGRESRRGRWIADGGVDGSGEFPDIALIGRIVIVGSPGIGRGNRTAPLAGDQDHHEQRKSASAGGEPDQRLRGRGDGGGDEVQETKRRRRAEAEALLEQQKRSDVVAPSKSITHYGEQQAPAEEEQSRHEEADEYPRGRVALDPE